MKTNLKSHNSSIQNPRLNTHTINIKLHQKGNTFCTVRVLLKVSGSLENLLPYNTPLKFIQKGIDLELLFW